MTPMRKVLVAAASLAIIGLSAAHAANVAVSTLAGGVAAKKIVTSTGANLPENSLIRVGNFNLPGGDTTILEIGLFPELNAIFKPIGEDPVLATDGTTGPIRANVTGDVPFLSINGVDDSWFPTPASPATLPLYIWAFATPAPDATTTDFAIFRDDTWNMPLGLNAINLQTQQITDATEVFRGTLDLAGGRIVLVPEPASALLGLIGLGLTLRRRRA
jgi:hypothetical protein